MVTVLWIYFQPATRPVMFSRLTIRYHSTGKPVGGPRRPYGPRKNKKSEPR